MSDNTDYDTRFDALCNNIAAAPSNDDEIEALNQVIAALWPLVVLGRESEVFEQLADLEKKAAQWARDADDEPEPPSGSCNPCGGGYMTDSRGGYRENFYTP